MDVLRHWCPKYCLLNSQGLQYLRREAEQIVMANPVLLFGRWTLSFRCPSIFTPDPWEWRGSHLKRTWIAKGHWGAQYARWICQMNATRGRFSNIYTFLASTTTWSKKHTWAGNCIVLQMLLAAGKASIPAQVFHLFLELAALADIWAGCLARMKADIKSFLQEVKASKSVKRFQRYSHFKIS